MTWELVEEHYAKNKMRLSKRFGWRAGTVEGGEEVVQEAYYRALRYVKSYNGEDFDRWFNTILNNSLREYKNAEKGYSSGPESDEEESYECPSYTIHIMKDIYDLIATKSAVQQEVLGYYFKQQYTAKNISEITQYSYAKCHQIIQRFKNELREIYE